MSDDEYRVASDNTPPGIIDPRRWTLSGGFADERIDHRQVGKTSEIPVGRP
jgi:hypothetical protein